MSHSFEVLEEISRDYRRFNTTGIQIGVRLNPPTDPDTNPVDHFLDSVNDLFEHVLHDVLGADMLGIAFTIRLTKIIDLYVSFPDGGISYL